MKAQWVGFLGGLAVTTWVCVEATRAQTLGTAFTFQGYLEKPAGTPIDDTCDFRFGLWEDPVSMIPADQVGPTLTFDGAGPNPPPLTVTSGVFTALLDFGDVFNGDARWLEVEVQCPGDPDFDLLVPRQELTPAPYARWSASPWKTSGTALYYLGGNVGIGTTTPGEKLELEGSISLHGSLIGRGNFWFDIRTNTTDGSDSKAVRIGGGGDVITSRGAYATFFGNEHAASPGDIHFSPGDGADASFTSGNVGIGTTTPQAKLDVGGTLRLSTQKAWEFKQNTDINSDDLDFHSIVDDTNFRIRGQDGHVLVNVRTLNGNTALRRVYLCQDGGRVGIGASTADAKLHVEGGSDATLADGGFAIFGTTAGANTVIDDNEIMARNGGAVNRLNLNADGGDVAISANGSGNLGVGTNAPENRLHVKGSIAGTAVDPANHIAQIENTSTSSQADVLALRMHVATPTTSNNFVSFLADGDDAGNGVGTIHGNGSNGVALQSGAADFAEWVPKSNVNETFAPGDVVGILAGSLSKITKGVSTFSVISDSYIVEGNAQPADHRKAYEIASFLGQVRVKVRGPVKPGDLIVPSGKNDGTGTAVSPAEILPEQLNQIVGQAWQSSDDPGVKRINALVGISPASNVPIRVVELLQRQDERIRRLEDRLSAIAPGVANLTAQASLTVPVLGAGILALAAFHMLGRRSGRKAGAR